MRQATQPTRLAQPSPYQRAIFDFIEAGRGHGVVEATAGSGKTTTLVEVAHRLPMGTRALFVAFNKNAALQLKHRLPERVRASTLHALGYGALCRYVSAHHMRLTEARRVDEAGTPPPKLEPNPKKYSDLAREALTGLWRGTRMDSDTRRTAQLYVKDLLHYIRVTLSDPADHDALHALRTRYSLSTPSDAALVNDLHYCVALLLEQGKQAVKRASVDFTDMVYVPVINKLPLPQHDFVCVDEAQDLSQMQLALVMRAVKPRGRLLFVGDRRQAIYGFTGADTEALDRITAQTGATVLPLSVTYRCPKSHVRLAKRFSAAIEAAPLAAEGRVDIIGEHALSAAVRPGDLVLCRNNAPLIRVCLALIQQGTAAVVRGNDLSKTLVKDAAQAFKGGLAGWPAKLARFEQREVAKLEASLPGEVVEAAVARRMDELACLEALTRHALAAGVASSEALAQRIRRTFGDHKRTVTLSSVHRAKGQEAERVFILYPHLMPAPYAKTDEDREGEVCVQFVAVTRSTQQLTFVEADLTKDEAAERWWAP